MEILKEQIPIISKLEQMVKETSPMNKEQKEKLLKSFRNALDEINEAKIQYLQLLGLMSETDKEFDTLYQNVSNESLSESVDRLNSLGTLRKKNPLLKKAFEGMGYRLMEQTRAGRKDDVFHNVLRIYMTSNQSFDKELLIAFKQRNREMFRVLIFSFLSGIIEPKK